MPYIVKFFSAITFAAALLMTGCGANTENQAPEEMPTGVKAIKVLTTDAPLTLSYSGQVVDRDEMKVQSKVSGSQDVVEGQILFKIDDRQYQAAVLQAEANLAKSKTALSRELTDLQRYEELWKEHAISEQMLTNQRVAVQSQESEVETKEKYLELKIKFCL